MAIRYLKESKSQSERREDDAKVKAIVEDTLADIEARGDAAIRELSEKFDHYSPRHSDYLNRKYRRSSLR